MEQEKPFPEKLEQKWGEKSYMGLRHPVLMPNEERFVSPARDIALLTVPLVRGALKSCGEVCIQSCMEDLGRFAVALSKCHNRILTDKGAKVCDIIKDLRTELDGLYSYTRLLGAEEIMLAYMTIYGLGCRESTGTRIMSDDMIMNAIHQAGILSRLPADLREQMADHLATKRMYEPELDRKAPEGEIKAPEEPAKEPDAEQKA
jgi:hypothetical protein